MSDLWACPRCGLQMIYVQSDLWACPRCELQMIYAQKIISSREVQHVKRCPHCNYLEEGGWREMTQDEVLKGKVGYPCGYCGQSADKCPAQGKNGISGLWKHNVIYCWAYVIERQEAGAK